MPSESSAKRQIQHYFSYRGPTLGQEGVSGALEEATMAHRFRRFEKTCVSRKTFNIMHACMYVSFTLRFKVPHFSLGVS